MKRNCKCSSCVFYKSRMFQDMGASSDGCEAIAHHKDYGFWQSLFPARDTSCETEPCPYYRAFDDILKAVLKDKYKKEV